ncbi:ComEC/Rec2 family competence protein [Novosphingobium sp.]|uniref:ComEC/Rec2 family competence protein n=1 Tax=Novosphingobium sp. TaxID=1874826 RepID=UPI001ECB231F|nr:ComEC/Rec2 family competence protein [Novosphingobium sp.]MBK9011666.1 ComEC/Rec2 family competence protein [Novosphingobium sp.]
MASVVPPDVPIDSPAPLGAALQHGHWRKRADLSSGLASVEHFLETAGFDRAPWLVAAFASGIAAWFALPDPGDWLALMAVGIAIAITALALMRREGRYPYLRQALVFVSLAVTAGCGVAWSKSALVGTGGIARPLVTTLEGRLLERDEQPAQHRVRLLLATREPGTGRAIRVRVNLDLDGDRPELAEGAVLRMRVRLVPPAPPMLPGGYDFARAAWFQGIAATGSVLGKVEVREAGDGGGWLAQAQRRLSQHVRSRLDGSPGTIAAAFASGDRGAIAEADEEAMRNSGLTHLLSISGLHVSAVIAAAYFLAMKLLAAWPWLALRVRVPLLAASCGALTGIGYTLLTGAEVPTIRSCVAALLVLGAMAIGREPLSLRMVAVAALIVLLLWPEALAGPSFQMSFAAVIAIVALHGAGPLRRFTAPREEPWWAKGLRQTGMLLLTGIVIELALMPIGLFHFHRAGVYGALANVIAIPLTTFISMPLIALALLADIAGAGAPFWWLAGLSLEGLLALAHWTAAMPGAVTSLPSMGRGAFALFIAGGLWLALWQGRVRLWGLAPAALGLALLGGVRAPDVLVSGDGRHVGITGAGKELLVLRETRSSFARDNLTELAGMAGETRALADWPNARCNADFCAVSLERGGRTWRFLIARGKDLVEERALAAACERVDVVIAERRLPGSCRPRWIKADRAMLARTGGLSFDLADQTVRTVAQEQGAHGWWRPAVRSPRREDNAARVPPDPQ